MKNIQCIATILQVIAIYVQLDKNLLNIDKEDRYSIVCLLLWLSIIVTNIPLVFK